MKTETKDLAKALAKMAGALEYQPMEVNRVYLDPTVLARAASRLVRLDSLAEDLDDGLTHIRIHGSADDGFSLSIHGGDARDRLVLLMRAALETGEVWADTGALDDGRVLEAFLDMREMTGRMIDAHGKEG